VRKTTKAGDDKNVKRSGFDGAVIEPLQFMNTFILRRLAAACRTLALFSRGIGLTADYGHPSPTGVIR
jgi:hypothetical protein